MALKIYTKTGDRGDTSLADGKRVPKSDMSVEMYGTSDELNSCLGVALSFFPDIPEKEEVLMIQSLLFELGSELAGFKKQKETDTIILDSDILNLETAIDRMQTEVQPMQSFILPGGTQAASFLHISRTVCRRLERLMVSYKQTGGVIIPESLKFVNRLSDYLFVLARFVNYKAGVTDTPWKSRAKG